MLRADCFGGLYKGREGKNVGICVLKADCFGGIG